MKHKFQFFSLSKTGGKAQFTMMLPFGGSQLSLEEAVRAAVFAHIKLAASEIGKVTESLGVGVVSQSVGQPAPLTFETVDELKPKESDYYYKDFRAISASLAPCYGLDFSKPGVLEASTPLLARQTVCKDHIFWSVDRWIGVTQETTWDAKGEAAAGVPGINAKLKIDSKRDPWVVRGMMMEPPAIHSCSVTVLFEFVFSHPDLYDEGRFWSLLMEEVDGELVRMIVTKIHGYWELSLVFQGAQDENKAIPAETSTERLSAGDGNNNSGASPEQQREGRETVKLTAELKERLGLGSHPGEDVPDAVLLPALTRTTELAATGATLLASARAECLRVAAIAEGGAEGALPEPIANLINRASAEELTGLTKMYEERAAAQFTQTCTKCGTQMSAAARSSVENDEAGEQQQQAALAKPLPRVKLH